MKQVPGLGFIPESWQAERARWLLARKRRAVRPEDGIVTAFRDGCVTLRSNRRTAGFTEAVHEIGYQGIRSGDLVVHSMDAFAGAVGVSDSDGKSSPVVHVYRTMPGIDSRYVAYVLRTLAVNGFIATLARGIRERSTSFDAATLSNVQFPVPSFSEQRHIADFLDAEVARIEKVSSGYLRMKSLIAERTKSLVDGLVGADGLAVPLRYAVRFREGPGIMADDFRDKGIPLIRISGLHDGEVTLRGCNYLDEKKVIEKWKQFRLQRGDYIISGSATMGGVSVVLDDSVVGAIPYTGLIILRPATAGVEMNYISAVLASSYFMRQIDVLKTGSTMQHFGPTHLSQVRIPLPSPYKQRLIASEVKVVQRQEIRAKELVDHQLELMEERKRALITAAVTGQIDVTTARGADLS